MTMEYFQICFRFALVYLDSGCESRSPGQEDANLKLCVNEKFLENQFNPLLYISYLNKIPKKFLLNLVLMVIKMTICGNDLSGHLVGSQSLENQPKTCCCTKDATQCTVRPL